MADKKISELPSSNVVNSTDLLVIVKDPAGAATTSKITANTLFSNVSSITSNTVKINNLLYIPTGTASANSTATGVVQGTMFYDNGYLYIATANNTLKRVALSTF